MSTSLVVTLDWLGERRTVGQLEVFTSQRGSERYQFTYDRDWCRTGFALDPDLDLLPGMPFQAGKLWGIFQDIAPDRWGRLVQDRIHDCYLSESHYLLGVSDYFGVDKTLQAHALGALSQALASWQDRAKHSLATLRARRPIRHRQETQRTGERG